jgi:hypothetical protein
VFCPNCGTQNTETAPTCAKCGFQLKSAAAPKFKGTMLMMNQNPPGAPAPPTPPPVGSPASGPSAVAFTAEAPPIGGAAPSPGARLKGTIVGVAPPNLGGPSPGPEHQTFGAPGDANPLAGTMANFAGGDPYNPPPPAYGAPPGAGGYGAAPPSAGPYGGPPGAPAGGFAPPAGGFAPPASGFGPPPGGDPYAGGQGFGPPPGADIYGGTGGPQGAPAAYGAPPAHDYGAQLNQGFQQAGQAFGQAADQFGNALNQGAMQPYQGGNPLAPGGMPGALAAGGPPKQFMTTLLLALFAGGFGVHRFYTGHTLYGVIQLFTGGGCGIWALYDIIMIVTGKYTDAQGRPLAKN